MKAELLQTITAFNTARIADTLANRGPLNANQGNGMICDRDGNPCRQPATVPGKRTPPDYRTLTRAQREAWDRYLASPPATPATTPITLRREIV